MVASNTHSEQIEDPRTHVVRRLADMTGYSKEMILSYLGYNMSEQPCFPTCCKQFIRHYGLVVPDDLGRANISSFLDLIKWLEAEVPKHPHIVLRLVRR